MKIRQFIIGSLAATAGMGPVLAQSTPATGFPQTQPYGQSPGAHAQPYQRPERDANGNRIIINGQQIGSSSSAGNLARENGSIARRGNTTLPSGGTLGSGSVTAVALGNSVNISNTFGSTIIINQTNNADQTVNVNGGPDGGGE